jgi:hypothetical protein
MGKIKEFFLSKLMLKFVYVGAGLIAGHLIGFLAADNVQLILGHIFKDPTLLPGAGKYLEAIISSGLVFASTFVFHHVHESAILPAIKQQIENAKIEASNIAKNG